MTRKRATFGSVRRLPSKRWQARYSAPDLSRHSAPLTFDTRTDAEAWLAVRRSEIIQGTWRPPAARVDDAPTLGSYSVRWLSDRELKPTTRELYERLLRVRILPTLGSMRLRDITPADVRHWHAGLGTATPTARSHAYGLLRSVLATAVTDDLIAANPCHIRGAATVDRVRKIEPASLADLEVLVTAMPEQYRALTLLAAWCGLRFGELTELRRRDLDLTAGLLRVRRGVVRVSGEILVGTPKSAAGVRDVAIPPHLLPLIEKHLGDHAGPGRDGLLFPAANGGHLARSTLYRAYGAARDVAGRPDLRWHDLRHTGAVLAASTGATLAELMSRLGHSTVRAALRYQHAAKGRDQAIARALSQLATRTETAE